MKSLTLAASLLVSTGLAAGCAASNVRTGQRFFAGCLDQVDDKATLRTGTFVCKGDKRDPEPFGGNGRACGSCHHPGDNFGVSVSRIATLPTDHPFFFPGLDEDQELLRAHGLVHVIVPGEIDEFRQTPKLVHLQTMCDKDGKCDALGLLGDRVRDLCAYRELTQPPQQGMEVIGHGSSRSFSPFGQNKGLEVFPAWSQ